MNLPRALDETHGRSVTIDMQDLGSGETFLGKPREPTEMRYSCQRSSLSLSLHVALVAIQVFLLVVWHQEWEHGIIFSVDKELRVARLVKGILTTFITLYSALLVFITQSLALRRDLHRRQLLTATHDNAVAWSGLGSAVARLWDQRAIPASSIGVLTALTYLASISALHTAFPGVAAPQSLFINQSVPISTQSLPTFNLSGVNETNSQDFLFAAEQYAARSLSFLPFSTPSNTLGLHEATLYDVLEPNPGTGSARVNATSFSISCGYIPDTAFNATTQIINAGGTYSWLGLTDLDVITTVAAAPFPDPARNSNLSDNFYYLGFPHPAVFYTSIPVLDSNNNTAPWIKLSDVDSNAAAKAVQVSRCSLRLIEQTVLVDSQSHNLTSFASEMPQTSTWVPFSGQPANVSTVYLHDVENQLAKIVASMFWMLGHRAPVSAYTDTSSAESFNVSLLAGQAIVTRLVIQDRLDLNVISIVECLVASLVLLGLSFRFSRLGRREPHATKLDGLDMLQTIWLFRDNPGVAASLEQVQVPTDVNLRRAGMVQVQLIDMDVCMTELTEELGEISMDKDKLSELTHRLEKPLGEEV
ncbi:hypothetical protein FB45DRAFT_1042131 [Roridomyces roridus]|uniref:Uncharacterized protein n=1 Tax=Roridomyces roridus TaxID=1738132 RepID=A0AAD7F936_9AGAR|nr:hypothetical protein FB45DRAFT_1042131 [Roridomyces roridus]